MVLICSETIIREIPRKNQHICFISYLAELIVQNSWA